uniref:Uncharacterized protein n=1 Tax=Candidatus Kentrum sp. LPFa TaxID=2126335 RepID=A0A450WCJ4_9GAMM|nr:MAG: hypothetical protein BECKLPF1236A_GA0070988_101141 [Candidatus Kentron sp. LPFa]VFK30476.1 MAG: hypothetical protein BECKLPF1236C_GA0070990_101121 [Candidatus Kentron sp. LPFa]
MSMIAGHGVRKAAFDIACWDIIFGKRLGKRPYGFCGRANSSEAWPDAQHSFTHGFHQPLGHHSGGMFALFPARLLECLVFLLIPQIEGASGEFFL